MVKNEFDLQMEDYQYLPLRDVVFRTLRQAIVEQKQVDAVVRNGGLYPLVSCALVKVKDEETSLLTLQVELERP